MNHETEHLRAVPGPVWGVATLLLITAFARPADAQLATNDLVVLGKRVGTTELFLLPGGSGPPITLTGFSPALPRVSGVEIDPTTGHLILFHDPATVHDPVEIWQVEVDAAGVVTDQNMFGDLSPGYRVVDTHRATSGCLLALLEDFSDWGQHPYVVARVAYLPSGWYGQEYPLDPAASFAHVSTLSAITADANGDLLLAYRGSDAQGKLSGVLATSPTCTGFADLFPPLRMISTSLLEDAQGNILVAGRYPVPFGGQYYDFWCGTPPTGGGYVTYLSMRDIHFDINTGDLFATIDMAPHLYRIPMPPTGCSPGAPVLVSTLPNVTVIEAVAQCTAEPGYGCGFITPDDTDPQIAELGPPSVSAGWPVQVSSGTVNGIAVLYAGLNNSSYQGASLPFEIPGTGVYLLQSADGSGPPVTLNGAGSGAVSIDVSGLPVGTSLYAQWLILDPQRRGMAASAGLKTAVVP